MQELERLAKRADKNLDKELFSFYKDALRKLKKQIKEFTDVYEDLSDLEKIEYVRAFKKGQTIEAIIDEVSKPTQDTIRVFLENRAIDGYMGTLYDVEGKAKMGLEFNKINERYIKKLVDKKTVGKDFSTRIYNRTKKMSKVVKDELLNGAVSGRGYRDIAKNIAEQTEATYKQSLTIARTEGKRVQTETTQDAYKEAENIGVKLQKRWSATLSDGTRESHADLDGQTVDIDEPFVTADGDEAMGPGEFGIPELDINCMCSTISIVEGIEPKLRRDQETKTNIPYKNYNEWKASKGG